MNLKRTVILYICLIICPALAEGAPSENDVAVVKGSYDNIELSLLNFGIPYDLLDYRDLEKPGTLTRYRAVFFPCGIKPPLEKNFTVQSRRTSIHSVSLKKSYREVDENLVAENIGDFIRRGGSGYFSGFAFKYLHTAFDCFEFFDDFPYQGLQGRVETRLHSDLASFCMKKRTALHMSHTGWVTIKSVDRAEILSSAEYNTPRGKRSGPISIILKRGSGEALVTVYDSSVFSDFRRFNIYRIAGAGLLDSAEDMAARWDQKPVLRIVDAMHRGESCRMYFINLAAGNNSIYFRAEKSPFQIDIYDRNMFLVESRDNNGLEQIFDIKSRGNDFCFIRIYPSVRARPAHYAMVTAHGARLVPHQGKISWAFLGIVLAVIIFAVLRTAGGTRGTGSIRRTFSGK